MHKEQKLRQCAKNRNWHALIVAIGALSCLSASCSSRKYTKKVEVEAAGRAREVITPIKVTAGNESNFLPDLSPNGQYVIYTSDIGGNKDLFEKRTTGGYGRRLTSHPSDDFSGVMSPDGTKIAFVSRRDDAVGDIHILDLGFGWFSFGKTAGEKPSKEVPLPRSEDFRPFWFPDSKRVVFSSRVPGDKESALMFVDIANRIPQPLFDLKGDQPAISSDSKLMAFVRNGSLYLFDFKEERSRQLTDGIGVQDGHPAFSPDGKSIYFVRYADDTDHNGKLDAMDNGTIWELLVDHALEGGMVEDFRLRPVTTAQYSNFSPQVRPPFLYFAMQVDSSLDIFKVPLPGQVDLNGSSLDEIMALARQAATPEEQLLVLRAGAATLTRAGQLDAAAVVLLSELRLQVQAKHPVEAHWLRRKIAKNYSKSGVVRAQAEILMLELRLAEVPETSVRTALTKGELQELSAIEEGLKVVEVQAPVGENEVSGRAALLRGRLLVRKREYIKAHQLYSAAVENYSGLSEISSEADLNKAFVTRYIADEDSSLRALVDVVRRHGDAPEIPARAARLALELAAVDPARENERLLQLREAAAGLPVLSAQAHVRIAEIFAGDGKKAVAENELRQIVSGYPESPRIAVDAAEKLLRAYEPSGRYEEAEAVLAKLKESIQVSSVGEYRRLEALTVGFQVRRGEALLRAGEPGMAIKEYRKAAVIRKEDLSAQRGIIDGLQRRKTLNEALVETEKNTSKNSVSAEALYLHGYARTYLIDAAKTPGDKLVEIDRCIKTVEAAREVNGQLLHIHQTLGWLYQQKGFWLAEYRKKGVAGKFSEKTAQIKSIFGSTEPNWLELAVDSYLTANYLSQPESIERANLSQNLAQTYYELGNYQKALLYYMRRLKNIDRVPVRDPETEALLWRNAGRAAFGVEEMDLALHLQRKALAAYEKLGRVDDVAYSLDALALTLSEKKQYAEALIVYQRLRESHQRTGHKGNEFGTIVNQGFVAFQAGFDQQALGYLQEAEDYSAADSAGGKTDSNKDQEKDAIQLDVGGQGSAARGFSFAEKKSMIAALRSQIYQRTGHILLGMEASLSRKEIVLEIDAKKKTAATSEAVTILLNNLGDQQQQVGLYEQAAQSFRDAAMLIAAKRKEANRPISRDEWLNSLNFLRMRLNLAALNRLSEAERGESITYATQIIEELGAAARLGPAADDAALAKFYAVRAALSSSGDKKSLTETGQNDLAKVLELSESIGHREPAVLTAALNYMSTVPELPARGKSAAAALQASRESVFSAPEGNDQIWKYLFARGFGAEAVDALERFISRGGTIQSPVDRITYEKMVGEVLGQKIADGKLAEASIVLASFAHWKTMEIANRLFKRPEDKAAPIKYSSVQKFLLDQKSRLDPSMLEAGDSILTVFYLPDGRALVSAQTSADAYSLVTDPPTTKDHISESSIVESILTNDKMANMLAKTESIYLADLNGGGHAGVSGSDRWNEALLKFSTKGGRSLAPSLSFVPCGAVALFAKNLARLPKGSISVVTTPDSKGVVSLIEQANSDRIIRHIEVAGSDAIPAIQKAAGASDIIHLDLPYTLLPLAGPQTELGPRQQKSDSIKEKSSIRISAPVWRLAKLSRGQASMLVMTIRRTQSTSIPSPAVDESTTALLLAALEAGIPSLVLQDLQDGHEPGGPSTEAQWKALYLNLGEEPVGVVAGKNRLLALGHPGFSKSREVDYARKNLDRYVEEADDLWDEDNFKDAATKYMEALYLARRSGNEPEIGSLLNKLVGAHYSLLDYEGALNYQEEIALRATKSASAKEIGETSLGVAVLAVRAGKYDKSEAALKVAEENLLKSGSLADVAKVWHYRGIAAEGRNEYEKTVSSYQQARDIYAKAGNQKLATQLLVDIGTVYKEKLSNFPTALEFYDKARVEFEKANDHEALLNLQIERANTLLSIGDVKWAIGVLEKHVIGKIKAEEKPLIWVRASQILAKAYFWAGMFQDARDQLKKTMDALKLVENERIRAGLEIDALTLDGMLKAKLDGYSLGSEVFQRAVELAKRHRFRDKESIAYSNLGFWAREYGETDLSIQYFNLALAIDQEMKSKSDIAFDQRNLGLSYILTGDFAQATSLLKAALRSSENLGLAYNAVYSRFGLGDVALREKKWSVAKDEFKAALTVAEKSFLQDFVWKAHAGVARAEAEEGDWHHAAENLTKAVNIIERLRAGLKSESSRTGFQSDRGVQAVYGDFVRALTKLGRTEEAWVAAERSRARAFIDSIGNQRLKFANSKSEALLETDRRLASEMELAERRKFLGGIDAEKASTDLDKLRQQSAANLEEMRKADPQLAQFARVEAISQKELSELLPKGLAVLEYMLTDREIYIWLAKDGAIRSYVVSHDLAVTEKLVEDYRALLQSFSSTEFIGRKLSDLFLATVAGDLNDVRRLAVVPHGPLHYLSFASLPFRDKYLLDFMPISYMESATFARFIRKGTSAAIVGNNVLAVGNPDRGPSLDLPFAEKEAQSITRFYPGAKILLNKRASEAAFGKLASSSDIIHIAAHGEFNHLAPAESRILLSSEGGNDGNLTLADIFSQELHASLISLSACETGLGKISTGDEVIGMNRAFFYAGAASIISSLWRISDVASAVVMKRFYRNLAEGMPKDLALQKAQMLARSYYPHPAYWTAFRLLGNPQ